MAKILEHLKNGSIIKSLPLDWWIIFITKLHSNQSVAYK